MKAELEEMIVVTTEERQIGTEGDLSSRIDDLIAARRGAANETVMRAKITLLLEELYRAPASPWWVTQQINGSETMLRWFEAGRERWGFADSVVGATAIEYEAEVISLNRFEHGRHQVLQYCAGLFNEGIPCEAIQGVLSDGVLWIAYKVESKQGVVVGRCAVEDLELTEIQRVDLSSMDSLRVEMLRDFLESHLKRDGFAPLRAETLAALFGIDGPSGQVFRDKCKNTISEARERNPRRADLADQIWRRFERYLSGGIENSEQVAESYTTEFYLSMVARLLAANVVRRAALRSEPKVLREILTGAFFARAGLPRLVERDYFAWIVDDTDLSSLDSIANEIQIELAHFSYDYIVDADLFGVLMSSLAQKQQRQLLGQEWTPKWLAESICNEMIENLADGESPRFIDVCSGSGAMVAAVCRATQERLLARGVQRGTPEAVRELTTAVVGFDIDPLATQLSRINWIAVNRDWLPFDGSVDFAPPIYNTDSLFSLSPMWDEVETGVAAAGRDVVKLDGQKVDLPAFLVEAPNRRLFDELTDRVERAVSGALSQNREQNFGHLGDAIVAEVDVERLLDEDMRNAASAFCRSLAEALYSLEQRRRDGVWAFILRNCYRPSLLRGQFNGLITNPPWLAMSSLESNPFRRSLKAIADRFDLTPAGSAFLHLEMATVFLAFASDQYLAENAVIGCVLPATIMNGSQHTPFRKALSGEVPNSPLRITPKQVWLVESDTFQVPSCVLIGSRVRPTSGDFKVVERSVNGAGLISSRRELCVQRFGSRVIWGVESEGPHVFGSYASSAFRQGGDIMPRTMVGVVASTTSEGRMLVSSPQPGDPEFYIRKGAHNFTDFEIPSMCVSSRFVHLMWQSNHLAAFDLLPPASVLLPAEPVDGEWQVVPDEVIDANRLLRMHFDRVCSQLKFSSVEEYWVRKADFRHKISSQGTLLSEGRGFLVVYGAGGGIPAAAYVPLDGRADRLPILDQTLYWLRVPTEEEASYICGVINHPRLLKLIAPFIPEGSFGDRHLHKLPPSATPAFDPANPGHVSLSASTQVLIRDLQGELSVHSGLQDPNVPLGRRRRCVRDLIESLPSYANYDQAARSVFDSLAVG